MDDNNGGSSSLPPFLTKTYEMINDSSSDSIISWSQNNQSFIVKNPLEFCTDLLPKFFKHKNFSSFIRQLNTYGFRKSDPEKWEFTNDDFVKDQPDLMKNIHRRKPVHSHSLPNLQAQNPLTESERKIMKDQMEKLKTEKENLLADLKNQEQEHKGYELQVKTLKDRLQHIKQRQKSMGSYISQVLKKPDLSPHFTTHYTRKRRLEDNQTCVSLESSLTFWENLVSDAYDKSLQSSLNLEVDESSNCAESQSLSCVELTKVDTRPKSSRIDMNSEPEPVVMNKIGVNDGFWEQFLTENPGSTEQQEVQSKRKDMETQKGDNKMNDQRKYWWN